MTGLRFAGRAVTGLAGVALVGATLWAAQSFPFPGIAAAPPSAVLSPVPGDQQRVCQGPLTLLGQSASRPSDAGYKGYAELTVAGTVDQLDVTGMKPAVTTAVTPASPSRDATGVPAYLTAPGVAGDRPTSLTVAQSVAVSSPGPAGFAATTCRQPSGDLWLVGGATTSGSSTMLSLVNPTDRPAMVRVELFGQSGRLPAPGLDGIEVPPREQLAVPLEGVAPGQQSLVVHVSTRGASLSAALHEVGVEGLTSHGIEIVSSVGPPATRLDIVGVPFPSQANEEDESVFAKRGATLRLAATGGEPATATITLRDASGTEIEPLEVELQPGVVSDVPLGAYPVGRYAITVEADSPVVGAVRSSLVSGDLDFAWYMPSPRLSGDTGVSVPPGPQPRLHLVNEGEAPITVRLVDPQGAAVSIALEPGMPVSHDVAGGVAYELEGLQNVAASVTFDGPGQMAGIPVLIGSPLAADITVYR